MLVKNGTLLLALFLGGCVHDSHPALQASSHGTAPLPYTERQVRETCRPGHTVVYRVDEQGVPATSLTLRVLAMSPESVDVETMMADHEGAPLGPPKLQHPHWDDFRQQAAFPRDATSISEQTITTPAGTFDALVYTVRRDSGLVERFYFAKNMPGPPLLYLTERDGVTTRTSTVVSISDRR